MLRTVHVSLNFNAHSTFNSDALFHCCKMFSGLSEIILNYYYYMSYTFPISHKRYYSCTRNTTT